jgi:methionyl-tRNA formyltransferase
VAKRLRVVVMTQYDRFFIPTNIAKVSEICNIVEIVDVNSKYSLDNQISNYFKWFGLFQCAKMGLVTIGREIQKYLDRAFRYRLFKGCCSVKDVAKALQIRHCVITDSNDPEYVKHIKDMDIDLIISFSAPQIIKEELLTSPKYGVINVHGSLLPDFRGCLPSFWYLYCDEKISGATVHYMSEKIDDGDIIEQGSVDISDCMSMFQVMKKTKTIGGELMVKAIQKIADGTVTVRKNDITQGRYFTWPTVEEAKGFRKKGKKLI